MTGRIYQLPRRRRPLSASTALQITLEEAHWLAEVAERLHRGYRLDTGERCRLRASIARLDMVRGRAHG